MVLEKKELEKITKKANDVVSGAASVLMSYYNKEYKSWEKDPDNIVTEADIAVNKFLEKGLGKLLPDAGWLSEETADNPSRLSCNKVWVVDPLDGTKEFIKKIPELAISVALVEKNQPVIGIINNPVSKEQFVSFKGGGVFYNGKIVSAVKTQKKEKPVMLASRTDEKAGMFEKYKKKFDVRPVGSIAYKLAKVAIGDADLILTLTPKNEWDICAGVLLINEAGGTITHLGGSKLAFNKEKTRIYGGLMAYINKDVIKGVSDGQTS